MAYIVRNPRNIPADSPDEGDARARVLGRRVRIPVLTWQPPGTRSAQALKWYEGDTFEPPVAMTAETLALYVVRGFLEEVV